MGDSETNNTGEQTPDWRSVRREQRYARREGRRESRYAWRGGSSAWIAGLVLIVIGGVFLADNFGLEMPGHWWALVFLIPAVGALGRAASLYRSSGRRLDGPVVTSLASGLLFVVLTVVFLTGADWGLVWPVLLIVIGLGMLARNMVAPRR